MESLIEFELTDSGLQNIESSWNKFFEKQGPLVFNTPIGQVTSNTTYFDLMYMMIKANVLREEDLNSYGIFKDDKPFLVCEGKEKAEKLLEKYPGCEIYPVEYVNREWIKK